MSSEDPSVQIEKDLKEKEAKQELFQEKVVAIGELHTERALWANKIGQLKSVSITQTNEMDASYEDNLNTLESMIEAISKEITDFKAESIEHLKSFKKNIENQFKELEKRYNDLEKKDAEADQASS